MGETARNLYAPYGLMSAAQHYSLYLRHYVDRYGVPEDAAAAVALTCRDHAQLNSKALMRGRPLSREEYDAARTSPNRCASSTAASRPTARPPSP
ncbi:MAG: hypothetical protein RLN74_07795 [Ilumatobacter fluminis]